MGPTDDELAQRQHMHWQRTYQANPSMYGMAPSSAAVHAADVFRQTSATTVLDLGAGHGRDSAFFAEQGFTTYALDVSSVGLGQLRQRALEAGVTDRVFPIEHDVRRPLPLAGGTVDGAFAHMLLCMALSTSQIRELVGEIRRVLRPGGALVYTVRHTGDTHYGAGISHGDSIYEHGGFAVHFFDRSLVHALAESWTLMEVRPFEEGELPRRLWRVTQAKLEP